MSRTLRGRRGSPGRARRGASQADPGDRQTTGWDSSQVRSSGSVQSVNLAPRPGLVRRRALVPCSVIRWRRWRVSGGPAPWRPWGDGEGRDTTGTADAPPSPWRRCRHEARAARNSRMYAAITSVSSPNAKWPESRRWTSARGRSRANALAPAGPKIGSFLPHTTSVGGW